MALAGLVHCFLIRLRLLGGADPHFPFALHEAPSAADVDVLTRLLSAWPGPSQFASPPAAPSSPFALLRAVESAVSSKFGLYLRRSVRAWLHSLSSPDAVLDAAALFRSLLDDATESTSVFGKILRWNLLQFEKLMFAGASEVFEAAVRGDGEFEKWDDLVHAEGAGVATAPSFSEHLNNLHKKFDTSVVSLVLLRLSGAGKPAVSSTVSVTQYGCLDMAALHMSRGHHDAAVAVLFEGIRVAQAVGDSACAAYAMAMLSSLRPALLGGGPAFFREKASELKLWRLAAMSAIAACGPRESTLSFDPVTLSLPATPWDPSPVDVVASGVPTPGRSHGRSGSLLPKTPVNHQLGSLHSATTSSSSLSLPLNERKVFFEQHARRRKQLLVGMGLQCLSSSAELVGQCWGNTPLQDASDAPLLLPPPVQLATLSSRVTKSGFRKPFALPSSHPAIAAVLSSHTFRRHCECTCLSCSTPSVQRQPPCDHPEVLGRELLWLGFPTLASSLFSDALASVEPLSCLAPAPPPQRTEDDLGVAWDARTHRRILSLLGRAGCSSVFAAVHSPPSAAAALPDVISALTLCSTSVCYLSLKVECLVVLAALICALGQPKMSSDILSSVMPRLMENGPPDLRCRALLTSATCEVSAGAPPPPRRLQRALNFAQRAIADAEQANEPSLLREAVHMAAVMHHSLSLSASPVDAAAHVRARDTYATQFLHLRHQAHLQAFTPDDDRA